MSTFNKHGGSRSANYPETNPTETFYWGDYQTFPLLVRPTGNDSTALLGDSAMSNPSRRIVKIFICDPHPSVPLERALLYQSTAKLTDLTDEELFYEVNLKELLEAHNLERVVYEDKEKSSRDSKVYLGPAKIRDLKMVVKTLVEF